MPLFTGIKSSPSGLEPMKSDTEEIVLSVVFIIIGCGLGFLISCAMATLFS